MVTTIGRPAALEQLLESLHRQEQRPAEVVVSDQGASGATADVVAAWADRLAVRRVTSTGGAAAGRNAGLDALAPGWDAVGFPDDDVTYPPDTLRRVADALGLGLDGVTGRLTDQDGTDRRLTFGAAVQPLHPGNVWTHAIEATTFLSRGLVDGVGRFDPELGVGAPTPWQSAEGTDYLLRALRAGKRIAFDPAVAVVDNINDQGGPPLRKVRNYARGTGYVTRRHYGLGHSVRIVGRPLGGAALSIARGQREAAARHLQAALGRTEGLLGRTTSLGNRPPLAYPKDSVHYINRT